MNNQDLFDAVQAGNEKAVIMLIEKGADPNAINDMGASPLHFAAVSGEIILIRNLLENGANPNIKDEVGTSPLHLASMLGAKSAVKALLQAGADINIKDINAVTPIHGAAMKGHASVISLLIENGAHRNVYDNDSFTPLDLAIKYGHSEAQEALSISKENKNKEKKRDDEGYVLCKKCGQRALANWTCPKCGYLFCDICCGQSNPDSREIEEIGGFTMTTSTIGFSEQTCPFCDKPQKKWWEFWK